jgi:hypothetical protein
MRSVALAVLLAGAAFAAPASAERLPLPLTPCRPAVAPADGPGGLQEYVGTLHEHSAYSDGFPDSIPADYYRSGKCFGLDFLVSGEHSDNLDLPMALNEECLPPASPAPCALADKDTPANSFRKWDAMAEQADAEQTADFTAGRGFEWSSDRFGHMNVYFSTYQVNAKDDGGYAALESFYAWAKRSPELHGGGDGLLTFNHPGDKTLCNQLQHVCEDQQDPGYNWNDFAYDPGLDDRMVGIELFNGTKDFGPFYFHALDKGWHLGALGVEDKGHQRTDHWGADNLGKTVMIEAQNTRAAIRDAMLDRRMYATLGRNLRLDFTVDGATMGSRLERAPGAKLDVDGALRDWDGRKLDGPARLEVITNGGQVLASADDDTLKDKLDFAVPAAGSAASRYLYLRALRDGRPVAYSSPIWIEPANRASQWLAGDLHVHTCYSHDVFCGPLDEPFQIEPGDDPMDLAAEEAAYVTDPDNLSQIETYGMTVGERFEEAMVRGLDYMAITDHGDVRSVTSRGFGAEGVIGIPGYENSIRGHAQVLGSRTLLDNGDGQAPAINRLVDALHAKGGVFQANHPGYTISAPFASCANTAGLHWKYGYDVRPDTIEVWNPTSPVLDAEAYLECWLDRGAHIGVTGGSDSHWKSLDAVQGVGNPTTWVLARGRTSRDVLSALRAGRTSVTRTPPNQGGAPLLLEARRADGTWANAIGETIAPGTAMRVRSESAVAAGLATVRANGQSLVLDTPLPPGGTVDFTAPDHGWVRAILHTFGSAGESAPDCHHELGQSEPASSCAYDHSLLGLTSPAYVAK